jgi:hypothetical protein
MQRRYHRHDTVARIHAPARKNEFSWQELMTRMASPQQNFGLALRPINDNERRGIVGLDAVTKANAFTIDQMAWYRSHNAFIRAVASGS